MINAGVVDGQKGGLHEDIPQGFIPQLPPFGHSDADDSDFSHGKT